MGHEKFKIIIECNEPAKDSLEPLLKSLKYLGDLGCSRGILIEDAAPELEGEKDLSDRHGFDGDGPDRITKITVEALDTKKESKMDIKASLIDLGNSNPDLRPHLRKVLATLEKKASRDSLAMMHAQFVSKVEQHLDDLMRRSAIDSTRVTVQLSISVLSGYATIIYQYGSENANELRFEVTASPKVVAQRLMKKLESEILAARM